MNSRYLAGKLFFVLAAVYAVVGAVQFRYATIGTGLTWEDDLNPLFMIVIPRLIPFAASILSACFGLAYFGVEKKFTRPVNTPLILIHLVSYVLAIIGYQKVMRFWWGALGAENAANIPFPATASMLVVTACAVSLVAFGMNIFGADQEPR